MSYFKVVETAAVHNLITLVLAEYKALIEYHKSNNITKVKSEFKKACRKILNQIAKDQNLDPDFSTMRMDYNQKSNWDDPDLAKDFELECECEFTWNDLPVLYDSKLAASFNAREQELEDSYLKDFHENIRRMTEAPISIDVIDGELILIHFDLQLIGENWK